MRLAAAACRRLHLLNKEHSMLLNKEECMLTLVNQFRARVLERDITTAKNVFVFVSAPVFYSKCNTPKSTGGLPYLNKTHRN